MIPTIPTPIPTAPHNTTLQSILGYLQIATEIMAVVPSPAMPFAGIALQFEAIVQAALKAHAASTGKTVEEIIAQLHQITPA